MSGPEDIAAEELKRARKADLLEAARRARESREVEAGLRLVPALPPPLPPSEYSRNISDTEVNPEAITGDPTEADSFPPQWRYITTGTIRNVVKNSRRTGKTEGAIRRANRFVVRDKKVLYVGKVLKNVRHQFWTPLKDRLARNGVRYKVDERDLVLNVGRSGLIMGISADDTRDVEKGRGFKWDLAIIDEAQSFPDHVLEPLIDYVLIPTLIDTGGSLDLAGTPPDPRKGDNSRGYFVRLIRESMTNDGSDPRKGWHLFEWTMFENPHIDPARVHEAYAARGIGPGHPVWESEVMGRLITNPDDLVFPFDSVRNTFEALP